ncbi:MAG TPA: SCO family protein [Verrucomicrobiae bacterium]|nr:SCO family protein [Verrucomicrobiae bacterium]
MENWIRSASLIASLAVWLFVASAFGAPQKHEVTGILLASDPGQHTITVSCKEIPGYMDAMVMSFRVKDAKLPDGLQPGANLAFTLFVDQGTSFAEGVHVVPFESFELDPTEAHRLKLLENAAHARPPSDSALRVGAPVPDFRLSDQKRQMVSLSQFHGKVVALTFVYTRCPLPDYCTRLANNFAILQRRLKSRMGRDLILLTIVIDPVHDQPDALGTYANTWKADARYWHFLTGQVAEIQQVCRHFDMAFYPDEAVFVHSFHTVVIDRKQHLAANLEGNSFTAQQLGDLVQSVMGRQ